MMLFCGRRHRHNLEAAFLEAAFAVAVEITSLHGIPLCCSYGEWDYRPTGAARQLAAFAEEIAEILKHPPGGTPLPKVHLQAIAKLGGDATRTAARLPALGDQKVTTQEQAAALAAALDPVVTHANRVLAALNDDYGLAAGYPAAAQPVQVMVAALLHPARHY